MEVCPGFELIAFEDPATVCDRAFQIGQGLKVAVRERLIHNGPEVLSRLKLRRVRGQVGEPDPIRHGQVRCGVPAGAVEPEHDDAIPSRPGLARKQGQEPCEERLGDPVRHIPEHLARDRLHEGGDVQPLVAVVTQRDRPLAFGRPHPADDRLQPDAVLIRGPDLDRLVRVLGPLLGDGLLQLFLNVSHSSGVAAAGWRGRGFCTDHLIALSASQPRCGATRVSPSSEAIQAATLGPVHRPPSDGGVASRSGNRARSSGRSTLGALPLRRRKSPRASGPCALYRASSCSIQRGTRLVTAATSAIVCPRANNQITWKCRVAVGSRADRSLASRSSTLRCSATRAMARLRDSWRTSLPVAQQPRNPQSESIARTPYQTICVAPVLRSLLSCSHIRLPPNDPSSSCGLVGRTGGPVSRPRLIRALRLLPLSAISLPAKDRKEPHTPCRQRKPSPSRAAALRRMSPSCFSSWCTRSTRTGTCS